MYLATYIVHIIFNNAMVLLRVLLHTHTLIYTYILHQIDILMCIQFAYFCTFCAHDQQLYTLYIIEASQCVPVHVATNHYYIINKITAFPGHQVDNIQIKSNLIRKYLPFTKDC